MQNIRALLVDDEEEFISTLAERLKLRGIESRVAGNGEDALDLIRIEPPTVVVLDVMMPGMNGLAVMSEIKRIDPDIPVILLTGRGSTKVGIDGMNQGAFDFLMKPVKLEELIEKMNEAARNPEGKDRK